MKVQRILINIIIVLLVIIFLMCGYLVIDYFRESSTQQEQFNNLASLVEQAQISPSLPAANETTAPADTSDETIPTDETEGTESGGILAEYAQLYELNSDIVGWLKIDNTSINYPVMQTPDSKDYYLRRDFYKNYSSHGCIFVREECDVFAPSDNITIYGHHMRDGSMFSDLDDFTSYTFWEENGVFTFDTLTEHHTYQVFAVFKTTTSAGEGFAYHQFVDGTESEFNDFVATCQSLAFYDTGITPVYGDKIICLSTCEYSQANGRLVVAAVRIS
ncbi:MAG: class B sortase [Lachnospiraceae bacterium]|nr:class B sortase [Lachnospiraceae bacterium]